MKKTFIKSLADLKGFANKFAKQLKGGEVIGLVGDLGAGKTTFVQYLAAALGVKEAVRSPTFILMQLFETGPAARKRGIKSICHVDAYRLKDETELTAIGFDDYAGRKDTVTLVEWADRTPALHSRPGFREITFDFSDGESRLLRIS